MINADQIRYPQDNYVVLFTFDNKNRILKEVELALKTRWPDYVVEFDTRDNLHWTPEIVSIEALRELVDRHTHSIVTFFRNKPSLDSYRLAEDNTHETEETFIELHFNERKNLLLMIDNVNEVPVGTPPNYRKESYEAFFCSPATLSITVSAPTNEPSTKLTHWIVQTILSTIVKWA